jgi:hypothetical protein
VGGEGPASGLDAAAFTAGDDIGAAPGAGLPGTATPEVGVLRTTLPANSLW